MPATGIQSLLDELAPVSLNDIDNMRFMDRIDTKFVFHVSLMPDMISYLDGNYNILEIRNMRSFSYNTRYYDTTDYLFYYRHVTGRLARHKIRFRSYESTGDSFLEIKMRTNKNRTRKWRIESEFTNDCSDDRSAEFISLHIPYRLEGLHPVLMNKFSRITLVGLDTCERITLDSGISYLTMNGDSAELPFLAIAERKSEGLNSRSPFMLAARKIGIRPTGFSKYCMGNAILNDLPHKNILKPKLLLVKKIENEYT